MIDWSTVAPVLRNLFSSLATEVVLSPEFRAQWAEEARENVHPEVQKFLQIRVTSITGIGDDERRFVGVVGLDGTTTTERLVGQRRFIVEVRVEAHEHRPDVDRWCWSMIERIRTRLSRTRSRMALQAVNVALLDTGPATDASFTFHKDRINAAVMDVTFAAAFTDEDPISFGVIEHIEATSLLENAGGALLPEPPNYTDRLMP